jgi:hypothetical protein
MRSADPDGLLDSRRLDERLALFHPEAADYLIPSPEDLSDDPAMTLHLVKSVRHQSASCDIGRAAWRLIQSCGKLLTSASARHGARPKHVERGCIRIAEAQRSSRADTRTE